MQAKKRFKGSIVVDAVIVTVLMALLGIVLKGQVPPTQLSVQSSPVGNPQGVSGTAVGATGGQTVWYWVVANFPAGEGPATGPVGVTRSVGISNLSLTNFNTISWTPVPGASTYDVYRSDTQFSPLSGGSCASCAVAVDTTSTTVNDQTPAGIAYTSGAAISPATAIITVDNTSDANGAFMNVNFVSAYRLGLVQGSPAAGTCAQFIAGGFIASTGSACGGGGGGTTVTAASTLGNNLPVFGDGSRGVFAGTVRGTGTRVQLANGSSPTTGHCANFAADGSLASSGAPCAGGGGTSFLQSGNAFGATGVLGTTDGFDLSIVTNGVQRALIQSGGNFLVSNLLQIGGVTSTFAALKRVGQGIEIRLADDSSYANGTADRFIAFRFQGLTNNVKLVNSGAQSWLMTNNAETDFGLLQFGGATNAYPAWKRVAAGISARLADDSAAAEVTTGNLFPASIVTGGNITTLSTLSWGAIDAAVRQGNTNKVQVVAGAAPTSGNVASFDANQNLVDSGVAVSSLASISITPPYITIGGNKYVTDYMSLVTTPPVPGAFTAAGTLVSTIVNVGSAGALKITAGTGGASQPSAQVKAIGTNRTLRVVFSALTPLNSVCGIGIDRSGNNKFVALQQYFAQYINSNGDRFAYIQYNSTYGFGSTQGTPINVPAGLYYLQIQATGGNIVMGLSNDGGLTYNTYATVAQATALGGAVADTDRWVILTQNSDVTVSIPSVCTILSWQES